VFAASRSASAQMTYAEAKAVLKRHTNVIELRDGDTRVAICPKLQGRVMTSTFDGPEGRSLGWVNTEFLDANKSSPVFNNYGGEDRFWLGPEGGQFALWFAAGAKQELPNWYTPAGLNDGAFDVAVDLDALTCKMNRTAKFVNASNTQFEVEIERTIRMLPKQLIQGLNSSGHVVSLKSVGFESENIVTNRGARWRDESGLLSIWILGMFPPGDKTVIILPYRAGTESELGPAVQDDYFAKPPVDRLKVMEEAILFRGDGQFRSKIGTSQRRAKDWAGSIDFENNILTLVNFTMPADPAKEKYVNNTWVVPQPQPYAGDVVNSYNDGPATPGAKSLGGFYELETMSPTRALATGQSITHKHRTIHVQGPIDTLAAVAKNMLGVDLTEVRKAMP
jgi:hypothetical protein